MAGDFRVFIEVSICLSVLKLMLLANSTNLPSTAFMNSLMHCEGPLPNERCGCIGVTHGLDLFGYGFSSSSLGKLNWGLVRLCAIYTLSVKDKVYTTSEYVCGFVDPLCLHKCTKAMNVAPSSMCIFHVNFGCSRSGCRWYYTLRWPYWLLVDNWVHLTLRQVICNKCGLTS